MHVLALEIELHLPDARSLKDRRAVVKSLVEAVRHRHGVAAADVGYQDLWQRAVLGYVAVAGDAGHVESVIDAVERHVWSTPGIEVIRSERHWMEVDPS